MVSLDCVLGCALTGFCWWELWLLCLVECFKCWFKVGLWYIEVVFGLTRFLVG